MKRYLSLAILFGLSLSAFAQSGKARKSDGTECTAFPCVVASVSLTGQSQPIPRTTLLTPSADGVFRISTYLSISPSADKQADWQVFVSWKDDFGGKGSGITIGQDNSSSEVFIAQDVGGQALLYQTRSGNGAQANAVTYDLFITVEQLQ